MTGQREVTRYATPSLTFNGTSWLVVAQPWGVDVGLVVGHHSTWYAKTGTGHPAGLWPTKQAAAEVLVKQAGYEVEMS
jgi:hypothetical protein